MREVFIVKHAIATVLGDSLQATWPRLLAGQSAFGGGAQAARVSGLAPADGENRVCALTRRVLDPLTPAPAGAFVVWTGIKGNAEFIEADQAVDMPWLPEHYHQWAVRVLGTDRAGIEVNAACASSTLGIAIAAQKIARGEYGCALVCGGDVVTQFVASGFSVLKALTPTRCRPFDIARDGMCIGDGAVAMLLADAQTARDYRLDRLAKISGWGISNDANHITGPSMDGAGLVRAIQAALEMAGVHPDEVQAFCAHGTGTVFNDSMELAAVEVVFGERRFPIFSIKGAIGHTLGAAGGIDAAVCVNALAERQLPPTAGLESPEPRAEGRVSRCPQAFDGRNILTSNSGFGGINAALLLSAVPDRGGVFPVAASHRLPHVFSESGLQREAAVEQRGWPLGRKPGSSGEFGAIHVLGGGWVTAAGYGRMGDGTKPVMRRGIPTVPPASEIYADPPLRLRRFDRYCRIGCAAIALALQDAGMERVRTPRPIGIIASTRYGCFETDLAFKATAGEKNGIYASPGLFSYTLPGIALSEAAILFQLTGPTFTVGDPVRQRGRRALEMAVDLITSGTCPAVLAGWLDAENRLLRRRADDDDGVRGAVFVVLSTGHAPRKIGAITQKGSELFAESGMRISSVLDLVG